ncbi:hypothetical protein ZWY2020_000670 [Hordeum vulgare]|nr:hypothetical protein ZWY2020_000670 [Hordeum vulgare]
MCRKLVCMMDMFSTITVRQGAPLCFLCHPCPHCLRFTPVRTGGTVSICSFWRSFENGSLSVYLTPIDKLLQLVRIDAHQAINNKCIQTQPICWFLTTHELHECSIQDQTTT